MPMRRQPKLAQIVCQGTPDCQWGDIYLWSVKRTPNGWEQTIAPCIGYEFAGVNDFQDTMEAIRVRYEVVEEVWAR